jgi:hypothetical protein
MHKLAVFLPRLPSQLAHAAKVVLGAMRNEIGEIFTLDDVAAYLKVRDRQF